MFSEGIVVSDAEHHETVRTISRITGPVLGPFESYLTMRGIKTLALVSAANAKMPAGSQAGWHRIPQWSASTTRPIRHTPTLPQSNVPSHPDSSAGWSALKSRAPINPAVLAFMDRLKMVVPGTSLGDVHTLLLYPAMASHRDVSPKVRERMGIREDLVRVSVGIESADDIIADLDQALRG